MAESTVKSSKLKQMPKRKGNGAAPIEPEPAQTRTDPAPSTPFDDSPPPQAAAPADPPKKKGRPATIASSNASKSILQIIAEVPRDYWEAGTARVKIYRLAPLINRNVTSEHRFITECLEPIDEQGLKRECGSGRYRLYLNYKNSAGGGERETARGEVDILDPAFPPKIPAGEWMDDPRNRQWAWAKPKEPAAQQAASSLGEVVDVIRAANEMRKEIREEMAPPAQPQAQPAAPVATVDPWSAAEKILNMRTDNPMLTILQAQLTNMETAAEKARERQAALEKELRDMLMARLNTPAPAPTPPAPPAKSLLEQLTEATDAYTKLKTVFGGGSSAAEAASTVVRSRMSGTMEAIKEIAPLVLDPLKPLINAAAHRLTQPANGQQPVNGHAANGQQQNRPAPGSEDDLIQFVERSLMEPIIEYLNTSDGEAFAELVYNGWPARLKPLQNFTHHQMPGQQGAPVIVELFKHSDVWTTQLAHREADFKEFVREFCAWRPEGEQQAAPDATAAAASSDTENWDSGETEGVRQEDKG